jgi:LacI family transcriptional regulator
MDLTESMSTRPTIKDLAEEAGVSLATVDRVLNGRAGASKKTIHAVNSAIERIGFERNHVAATLARKRGYRFGFVVSSVPGQFLDEVLKRIEEANAALGPEMVQAVVLRVDQSDPHQVAGYLGRLSADDFDGVAIMAPETPQIRDAIKRLEERGMRSIAFIANQQTDEPDNFVGIDNRAAGATAGRIMGRFCRQMRGSVMVIAETMQSRDSLERRLGFDRVINDAFPNLQVLPSLETRGDAERAFQIIRNTFRHNPDLAGAYVASSEARVPIEAIGRCKGGRELVKIVHERTPFTQSALLADQVDAVVAQDPGHLVRSAIRTLRAKCEKRATLASQEKIRIEVLLKDNV